MGTKYSILEVRLSQSTSCEREVAIPFVSKFGTRWKLQEINNYDNVTQFSIMTEAENSSDNA